MSGVHCIEEKLTGILSHSSCDNDYHVLLKEYQLILDKFLHPNAGTLLVQHKGGLNSIVLSSKQFTSKVQVHHPTLKFVNSLICAQDSACSDYGFYTGALCLGLLREMLTLEHHRYLSRRVVKNVFECLMDKVLTFLETQPTSFVATLNLAKVEEMTSFVGNFIDAKNLGLTSKEKSHIQFELVKTFLESLQDHSSKDLFADVKVVVVEGQSSLDTRIIKGVLYRDLDPNTKLVYKLKQKCQLCNLEADNITPKSKAKLRLLLFNVPLAFEHSESESVQFKDKYSTQDCYTSLLKRKLLVLTKTLNVNIIASQKFIDETVKHELERNGVLVLERLGTSQANALQRLSGALMISNICDLFETKELTRNADSVLGLLTNVDILEVGRATYIHLANDDKTSAMVEPVITLLMPIVTSGIEEGVEVMAQSVVRSLREVSLKPLVLAGRGCLEAGIVNMVMQLTSSSLDCNASLSEFLQVSQGFNRAFAHMSINLSGGDIFNRGILSSSGHLYEILTDFTSKANEPLKCSCGGIQLIKEGKNSFRNLYNVCNSTAVSSETTVTDDINSSDSVVCKYDFLDNYVAKVNAVRLAFQGASQLYDVTYCVFDR